MDGVKAFSNNRVNRINCLASGFGKFEDGLKVSIKQFAVSLSTVDMVVKYEKLR